MLQELTLSSRMCHGTVTVTVCGELDANTAPNLAETLGDHLIPEVRELVIDVSDVAFMSSAGLQVLLAATEAAAGHGTRVGVRTGGARAVHRVLQAAGGEHLLPLTRVPQPA